MNIDALKTLPATSLKNLLIINMLYAFIVSALAVVVPLYLLEQKVDITWIGIILSLGPLTFMVIRTVLASIADDIGTKKIGILYSLSNLIALLLYIFVVSPIGFAIGIFAEGVRASGFWAITRTEVLSVESVKDAGKTLANFSNMRQLADGFGKVAIGFMLAYLAFQGSFVILFVLSIALTLFIVLFEKDRVSTFHIDRKNIRRIFKKRPKTFWYSSLLQLFLWLTYNSLVGFLIPVYFISSLGLSYSETGGLIAILSLVTAASALILMRLNISKRLLLLLTLLSVPALILMPFAGKNVLPLLIFLAIGMGCGNIIGEYLLADQVIRSKDVSTDIGVLYAPLKISEFLFLSLGGLVISKFGYMPLFFVLAISLLLYVVFGRAVINPINPKPN